MMETKPKIEGLINFALSFSSLHYNIMQLQ